MLVTLGALNYGRPRGSLLFWVDQAILKRAFFDEPSIQLADFVIS